MRATCRNSDCGKSFTAMRAGARYCSGRCRMASHRKRQAPEPEVMWLDGKRRRRNVTDELADHLIEIAQRDDDGLRRPAAATTISRCHMATSM
jgi:hypothetical protein